MASDTLKGLKVAILVTDGFEKVALTQPRKALDEAGAVTRIVSPKSSKVRSWNFTNWDEEMSVDVNLDEAKPQDFDALHLPGGVINPDALRIQPKAVAFAKHSSTPASRWLRSAMAPGRSLKPARRADAA
jgi:protease I